MAAKKKAGRPPLKSFSTAVADLRANFTAGAYQKLMDELAKGNLKGGKHALSKDRIAVYGYWKTQYDSARGQGKSNPRARKQANEDTARAFLALGTTQLSRIRNIQEIKKDTERALRAVVALQEQELFPAQERHNEAVRAIQDAVTILGKRAYKGMLDHCTLRPENGQPVAVSALVFDPKAAKPDSPLALTGTLARAFLKAHRIAERVSPGYTERDWSAK